jgi:hypothetical protein
MSILEAIVLIIQVGVFGFACYTVGVHIGERRAKDCIARILAEAHRRSRVKEITGGSER